MRIIDFKVQKTTNSFNLEGRVRLKVLLTLTFVVFALVFSQLVYANNLATDGEKLGKIQDEIKALEEENTYLKVEIAKESSFQTLSKKAKDLGFDKKANVVLP